MNNVDSYNLAGVSQKDRYPDELRPEYFLPLERDEVALILQAIRFSRQFNYYNEHNQPDGTWEDFFLSDINLMIRVFSSYDGNNFLNEYALNRERLLVNLQDQRDQKTLHLSFESLINHISGFTRSQKNIQHYLTDAMEAASYDASPELKKIIDRYFEYSKDINRLFAYTEEALGLLNQQTNDIDGFARQVELLLKDIDDQLHGVDEPGLIGKFQALADASRNYQLLHQSAGFSFKPQTGLLMAFLKLYQNVENQFNRVTKKHLDYFYQDLLGIMPGTLVADKVHVFFSLNPAINEFRLKKGEQILTGLPGQPGIKSFATDEEIILNNCSIVELKTLCEGEMEKISAKDKDGEILKDDAGNPLVAMETRVYAADNPVYLPGDFLHKNTALKTWPVLGENQDRLSGKSRTLDDAELGFLLASPILYTSDGKRKFTISFNIDRESYDKLNHYAINYEKVYQAKKEQAKFHRGVKRDVILYEMLKDAFMISVTGTEGWVEGRRVRVDLQKKSNSNNTGNENLVIIQFELESRDPGVSVYDPLVHGDAYETEWPLVRIMLNNNAFYHSYTFFKNIHVKRITLNVKVENSETLQLRNNFGPLSLSGPFQVFGPQPEIGSYLDIRNTNIFNRYTRGFSIKFKWFDLPRENGGFEDYFSAYKNNTRNDSFKVTLSVLDKNNQSSAQSVPVKLNLFRARNNFLDKQTLLDDGSFERLAFTNEPLLDEENNEALKGFNNGAVRVTLTEPLDAFGHKLYNVVFPETVLHNSGGAFGGVMRKKIPLPNLPYTPRMESISLDYELACAEEITPSSDETIHNGALKLWHRFSFGSKMVFPDNRAPFIDFIPSVGNKANLYIGLNELVPGKELSLLFHMDEHISVPVDEVAEKVNWHYLADNNWEPFDDDWILTDDTFKFTASGLVKLFIPPAIRTGNTILNPSLFWIRASSNTFIGTRVKAVFAQAVSATRMLQETDVNSERLELEPGSLKAFSGKFPEIISVHQPFRSFGGNVLETEDRYYTRVSELLRHKQRLLTAEDISQKILELYPNEVFKVICYNARNGKFNYRPGSDIQVVLIPFMKSFPAQKITKPGVKNSTIIRISRYLKEYVSPFIRNNIEVRNPDYELVKVVCSVVFREDGSGSGRGKNKMQLNDDLKRLISPWLFGSDAEIMTEGYIYSSEVLNFIKNRPYVKYVTGFTLLHLFYYYNETNDTREARLLDTAAMNLPFLKTHLPGAIFISAENHNITPIESPYFKAAPGSGIEGLVIGTELLVGNINPGDPVTKSANSDDLEMDIYFSPKL